MSVDYSIDELDSFDDSKLKQLDWKNLQRLNGRLLELHGEGALGNEKFAKLPLRPILCIDRIDTIDEKTIEASFTFPANTGEWRFDPTESLEMLFQDQLDQLVGFWGCRKADGIGRALSSGACKLHQSLDFEPGKKIIFRLDKRKWVKNKDSEGGTAVFNGSILSDRGDVLLETKNVIVGILSPDAIQALRAQYGGMQGVHPDKNVGKAADLHIPIYDPETINKEGRTADVIQRVSATQAIDQSLWPLRFHFRGDPVVPGNFGTHGMIALLKDTAQNEFSLKDPRFISLANKRFSGMIFEDPKQIRFELLNVTRDSQNQVIAEEANLYLENLDGDKLIEDPIYTFKNMTVRERSL